MICPRIQALIQKCGFDSKCWLDKLHRKKGGISFNRRLTVRSIANTLNVRSLNQMRSCLAVHRREIGLFLASIAHEEARILNTLSDISFVKLPVI